jgi:hypothetical protein
MAETNDLIGRLVSDTRPVTVLPPPWRRTVAWLVLSTPYVALIVLMMGMRPDIGEKLSESRFLIEEISAAATALAAAFAAFWAVIPGRARWPLFLPLLPLAVWLGSLSQGCIQAFLAYGRAGLAVGDDWICLPVIALVGFVPAIVIAVMIRRGAPLFPHLAVALAGLSAAALGNVGLRLFHPTDASLMVLVWQFGSVALLAALAGLCGPMVHNWRHAQVKP